MFLIRLTPVLSKVLLGAARFVFISLLSKWFNPHTLDDTHSGYSFSSVGKVHSLWSDILHVLLRTDKDLAFVDQSMNPTMCFGWAAITIFFQLGSFL